MQFTRVHLSLWLLYLAYATIGAIAIATIDDSDSSMVYSPADAWNDKTCTTCSASGLDQSQLFQGTWHDGTVRSANGDYYLVLTLIVPSSIHSQGVTITQMLFSLHPLASEVSK
jgi:hypothetical protein